MADEAAAAGGLSTLLGTINTSANKLTGGLSGATKAAVGLGGALLDGKQQLSAYSGAIAANTGLFGDTVGKLVDGLAKYADGALSEYQQLTNIGATFGKELKNVKVSAAELGLSVEDMTTFIKQNNESLRAFGGTTELAMSRFKAISTTILDSQELGTKLRALGYTTQDINENLALYGEISDANSRTDRASVQEQAEAAKNLMVELDGLSKLTGKQRDVLADEMKERRRQGDVNAFLTGKTAEEQTAFTNKLVELQNTLGKDAADAFVDVALRGAPTTETTRNALLAMGSGADDLYAAAQQFNSGDIISFQDSLQKASSAALDYQNTEQFRQAAMLGGISQTSSAFADASNASYDYKNAVDSVRDGTMTSEQAREALNDKILAEQATQMEQTTGIYDTTIGIQEDLRKLTTTVMETTIPHIEEVAITALNKISEVMPSPETIAAELAGGIDNLFNAAQGIDKGNALENVPRFQQETTGAVNEHAAQAHADAAALGATTTEAGETTDANVNSAIDGVNQNIAQAQETVNETQTTLTAAEKTLVQANERLAELTSQGFTTMEGPVQQAAEEAAAAKEEASAARIAAEAAESQASAVRASVRLGHGGKLFSGGRAEGGGIGANEFAMVGEAGPEFVAGPAQVMSAKTSMGVMQNLMKGIKSLDTTVQNNGGNQQNTISNNNNVAEQMSNLMANKFDTMIQQLQTLVTIESSSATAQQKTFRATKSLQGNMLKGTI